MAIRTPCRGRFGACPNTVPRGQRYCPECASREIPKDAAKKREDYRVYNQTKRDPVVKKWMASKRYKELRRLFLERNPFCVECQKGTDYMPGRLVPAVILDHKIPHKGDYNLFWDTSNWQGLCDTHHRKKSAARDGSLGNPIK